MATKKNVLTIGLDPAILDFSHPEFAAFPGLNAEKVTAGINASQAKLSDLGYDAETCLINFEDTALDVVKSKLQQKQFDGVLIGAGIRVQNSNLLLFEKLVNLIHAHAPQAKLLFNSNPNDTANAVQRWI